MAGARAGDRRARRLHRSARLLVALAESQTRTGDGRALRAPVQDGGCRAGCRATTGAGCRTAAEAGAGSRAQGVPEPRQAPAPKAEPPPKKVAPKPEPKVEKPDPRAAEIAQKARKDEAERKKREQAAREKSEREKKEADQREAEKKKRDEQQRLAEARERQTREAEALRGQAEREQAARAQQQKADAEAAARARAEADYVRRIQSKVKGNVVLPPDMAGNPEAIFDVIQLPTGEIIDAVLRKSSGSRAYDDAVQRAIVKSSPLPRPDRPELFQRTLTLKFRPQD